MKFCVNYFITSRFTDNKTSDVDDGFQHLDKKSELDRKPNASDFFVSYKTASKIIFILLRVCHTSTRMDPYGHIAKWYHV